MKMRVYLLVIVYIFYLCVSSVQARSHKLEYVHTVSGREQKTEKSSAGVVLIKFSGGS